MTLTIEIETTDPDPLTRIFAYLEKITDQISGGYTEASMTGPGIHYYFHLNDGSKPF
jgi:hypothetical protein